MQGKKGKMRREVWLGATGAEEEQGLPAKGQGRRSPTERGARGQREDVPAELEQGE